MMSEAKILIGMKAICDHAGRCRKHVELAVKNEGFPAVKIAGRWESNTKLIDEWQLRQVRELVEVE